jgi:hypothetical protein
VAKQALTVAGERSRLCRNAGSKTWINLKLNPAAI